MKQIKVELNKKYNKLIPIKKIMISNRTHYLCLCDCGKEKILSTTVISRGIIKSCGCLVIERARTNKGRIVLKKGEAAFNNLYRNLVSNSQKRNIEFHLSKEEVHLLSKGYCVYCGSEPKGIFTMKYKNGKCRLNGEYIYNGIDRIDSKKGYIKGNVVSCCKICNYMKQQLSQEEFFIHIEKILKFTGRS